MSNFADDPVISVYLDMLGKTQATQNQPEYSEIYLRLAFKEACGKNHIISSDNLKLYRKLLVLYYCEEHPSITTVISIMERCFSLDDIYRIVAEQDDIIGKWWEFKNNYVKHSNKAKKRKISYLENTRSLNKKINI